MFDVQDQHARYVVRKAVITFRVTAAELARRGSFRAAVLEQQADALEELLVCSRRDPENLTLWDRFDGREGHSLNEYAI